jgi:F-type H+-transporting ATPase subunit b
MAAGGATSMLISQLLAFILLALVLVKFVKPPLGKLLDQRSRAIGETFEKIDRETKEAAQELAEYREKLARLEQETRGRMEKALAEAQRTRAQLLADAQAQVEAAAEKARREVQIERDKAVLELRQAATALTLAAADHLVGAVMNDQHHARLVDSYLGRLEGAGKP